MIVAEGLTKSFGPRSVVRNVSLKFSRGEMVGIVGPSGSGKSVLLKLFGGVTRPDSGRLLCMDGDDGDDCGYSVGFSFQEGALFDSMNVIDNVAFPLVMRAGKRDRRHRLAGIYSRAASILSEVGLSHDIHKMPGEISGGMRRRVGIARALVTKPELVLLDDPTGGLDPVTSAVIVELIRKLHAEYSPTVVIVSHDIRRLLPRVERLIALFDGEVRADVPVSKLPEGVDEVVSEFLERRYDFSEAHG